MTRSQLVRSLLTAHLTVGLHFLCFMQRAFYDFLRFDPLPEAEADRLRSADSVMQITHFPSFQLIEFESTGIPGIFTCLAIGYATGFLLGFYLSPQIVRFKFSSFVWWLCLLIVLSDIRMVVVLAKSPSAEFWLFLRIELIMAAIVAIVLGIVIGIIKLDRRLRSWAVSEEP